MALALPSGNLVLNKDSNTLIIKKIEPKHSDGYSCVVENSLGRQLVSSNITVIPKGMLFSFVAAMESEKAIFLYSFSIDYRLFALLHMCLLTI